MGELTMNKKDLRINVARPWLLVIAIIGMSVIGQFGNIISATVGQMAKSMPTVSPMAVQTIVTCVSLPTMIFDLLSPAIERMITKRWTILTGLTLALVGGITPVFTDYFALIYASRLVFGAGIGLIMPYGMALLGDIFTGETRDNMVGYASSALNFGSGISTLLVGALLVISWHASFLMYGLIAVPLVLFAIGYTHNVDVQIKANEYKARRSQKTKTIMQRIPLIVPVSACFLFLFLASGCVMFTTSAMAIEELHLKGAGFLALALTISGLVSGVCTMFFGKLHRVLHGWLPVIAAVIGGLGYLWASVAQNMVIFTFCLAMVGVAFFVYPYVNKVILDRVDDAIKNVCVSFALAIYNLGAFFSPYIVHFITKIIGHSSPVWQLRVGAGMFFFLALLMTGYVVIEKLRGKGEQL